MSMQPFKTLRGFFARHGPVRFVMTGMVLVPAAVALRFYMMAASLKHVPVTADESITVLQAKRVCDGELPLLVMAQPYQFPIEAYLSAPMVRLVARDTFGGRYLSFLEGFAALLLLAMLARRMGALDRTWPVMMLVMFPSAYLLMIQFGYSLPHNSPFYLASFGAMLLAVGRPFRFAPGCCLRFLSAGVLCGLAFANNMVALAFIAPILLVSALGGNWRHIAPKTALLGCGVCIGMIPYFAAICLFPGAHAAVAGRHSIGETLKYLWNPGLSFTLTRALGVTPTLYPDAVHNLDFAAWLFPVMPCITAAVMLSATALRAVHLIRHFTEKLHLELGLQDAFIGVAWMNLFIFAASERAYPECYRYLAPAAWSFPFIVGSLYIGTGKRIRRVVGCGCVALAALNAITAAKLTGEWERDGFAERVMNAPDLGGALNFLRAEGISNCVASHWQAYRINYLSDEKILCAQPINERFPDWPLPYKDIVDASTNTAYVFSRRSSADFNPENFETHLGRMNIEANKTSRGSFSIYHGFRREGADKTEEIPVPERLLAVSTSHNPSEAENLITDGAERWSTQAPQEKGMWIRIDLKEPRLLSRLLLVHGQYYNDTAPKMNIEARSNGRWRMVAENFPGDIDPFEFENGKPVYDRYVLCIRGQPVTADAVRLTIAEANSNNWWSLTKIRLFGQGGRRAGE